MISTPVFAIIGIPGLGTPELLIILAVVLILFGPKRLPQLGKSLGKTMKAIRDGADGKLGDADEADSDAAEAPAKKSDADAEAKVESKKKDNAEV